MKTNKQVKAQTKRKPISGELDVKSTNLPRRNKAGKRPPTFARSMQQIGARMARGKRGIVMSSPRVRVHADSDSPHGIVPRERKKVSTSSITNRQAAEPLKIRTRIQAKDNPVRSKGKGKNPK